MKRFIAVALFLTFVCTAASAQFGRNRIRENDLHWQVYETGHFIIHYYDETAGIVKVLESTLESAYEDYRLRLDISLKRKIPVVIYLNSSDFLQTNITDSSLDEGVGGFTELSKRRLVVPFKGDLYDFCRVVRHELVHVFQYEYIVPGDMPLSSLYNALTFPPLWMMEGMAEYFSDDWQEEGRMMVRENILTGDIPDIGMMDDYTFSYNGYYGYKLAQSFTEFLCSRFGEDKYVMLFKRLSRKINYSLDKEFKAVFDVDLKTVSEIWKESLKQTYWQDALEKKNPYEVFEFTSLNRDYGNEDEYVFMFSPVFSPNGEVFAAYSGLKGEGDVILAGAENGRLIDNMTAGLGDKMYDYIKMTPGGLCWSPDGERLCFIVRRGNRDMLVLKDLISGDADIVGFDDIDSINAVDWGGDGTIYATGQMREKNVIAAMSPASEINYYFAGSFLKEDIACIGDGRVAVVEKREYGDVIILYDVYAGTSRQLYVTDNIGSLDCHGEMLYFDRNFGDALYICSYGLADGTVRLITDSLNSTRNPSVSDEMMMFNIYRGGRYLTARIYRDSYADALVEEDLLPSRYEPLFIGAEDGAYVAENSRKYEVKLRPDVIGGSIEYNTGGYFRSYTSIMGTDVMGDYRFLVNFDLTSVENFEDIDMLLSFNYRKMRYGLTVSAYGWKDYFFDENTIFLDYSEKYTGGLVNVAYPLTQKDRVEGGLSVYDKKTDYYNLGYEYHNMAYASYISFVRDASRNWGYYHPLSGHRIRLTYERSFPLTDGSLEYSTVIADVRKYVKLSGRLSAAFRCIYGSSAGDDAVLFKIGGIDTVRGYGHEDIRGNTILVANAELRFPLIDYIVMPVSDFFISFVRGNLFADLAYAGESGEEMRIFDDGGLAAGSYGSVGFGARLYLGSFLNLKFDWAYRTDLNDFDGEPVFQFGISQDY